MAAVYQEARLLPTDPGDNLPALSLLACLAFSEILSPLYLPACLFACLVFLCLLSSILGYGYYRPNVTLFDPGWRGEQTKGPEDSEWGVVDLGNDPIGVADR